jgi:hypothetical protein
MISRLTAYWTNLPLRGKGLVVVAIPFIALLISGASFAVVEREQRDANAWVAHSLLVRNTAAACCATKPTRPRAFVATS